MNTQMMICMVIFVATLVSYMMNKIPMWLTAMISLTALYFTGCIDAAGALAGFSNVNTLLMATMFIVAAGFRRTSLVDGMCSAIMKLTRGSFLTAYFGYILIAVLLTNFIASPMVVYAIVSPLLAALCDNTGHSRSQYMFPIMVVCVACCGILPLSTAIQQAGQFTGFMETYGFTGMSIRAVDFTIGTWPILIIVPLWALGTALTNTGAGDMIGNALASAVGGTHNNYVLGALFFLIPFVLTQFMLNRSVSAVFVPICLLTCSALGANPTGLVLLVNAGSLTAFLTPMATPAVPMCMADGGYDLRAIFKSGALITLFLPFIYIFYTMTVFPAF